MECGIVTVDLHGRNTYQAKVTVDALLRRAGAGTYRLRLIHGCHQGHGPAGLSPGGIRAPPAGEAPAPLPRRGAPQIWCCGK